MADSDILKEFLVSLGFKLDQASLNKFDNALVKTTKAALAFGTTLAGMATAATAYVESVANDMADLYWSSVRLRDGVANIKDFELGLTKAGGSAQATRQALEGMATFIRTQPFAEGLLKNLGVQTRDINGNLRGTIDIVRDLAHLPMPYWLKVRWAERFGIDERTLQAIIREAPDAENKLSRLYQRAGIDADVAARKFTDFHNRIVEQEGAWGVLADIIGYRLLPVANAALDWATKLVDELVSLDGATGGLSTEMGLLAIAVWGVNTALRVTFGTTIMKALAGLALSIATMTATVFPALGEAIFAIAVAIEATPFGWLLLIGSALAGSALLVIHNWDKVKQYFNGFVGWLRDKYNSVAKYLGLPKWAGGQSGGAKDSAAPPRTPDFQNLEHNLGPNSSYGSGAANDNQQGGNAVTGKALAFFQKMGWSANQAAGIVANLLHESVLNPSAVGDHGQARGIAQWHKDRQDAFKGWAGHDLSQSTLDEQLAFVNHELLTRAHGLAGRMLANAQSAGDAAMRVSKYYEAPKDELGEMARRGRTAESLVSGTRLSSGNAGQRNVTVNAKTDIHVEGGDAAATGRAVGREQSRVNGDLARNFAGASQ